MITDHFSVFTTLNIIQKIDAPTDIDEKLIINFADLEKSLLEANFDDVLNSANVDDSFKLIIKRMSRIVENNSFFRKKQKRFVLPRQPWMCKSLLKALKKKNKIKYKLNKNPLNVLLKNKYLKYKNTLNDLIRREKRNYYEDQFKKFDGNIKKTWSLINKVLKTDEELKTDGGPAVLKDSKTGIIITGDKNIANYANELLGNCENDISKNGSFKNLSRVKNSAFFQPVTDNEICNIIKRMKNSHSCGYDKVSNWMIKKTPALIHVLTVLCNNILETGIFPDSLKKGIIYLKYKGGPETELKNYRPITLISSFSKIVEKIIYSRMLSFLKKNNILNKNQYAFQSGTGCDDALFEITEYVKSALDNGDYVLAASIDLEKAFDNVSHDILLYKLECYGFRGICYRLLKTYIQDRTMKTQVRNALSEDALFKKGVPQGSVLGPLLFNIFINDLTLKVQDTVLQNYADDNLTYCKGKNVMQLNEKMNEALTEISGWYKDNELKVNVKKSALIYFGSSRKIKKLNIQSYHFKIGNEPIEIKNEVKYLGVILDSNLSWKKHILKVQAVCAMYIPIFYRIRKIMNKNTLMTIFYTCLRSKIMYALKFYGATYKTNLQCLNIIFRKVIRIINFKQNRDSLKDVMLNENILNIYQLHIMEMMIFYLKIQSEKLLYDHGLKLDLYIPSGGAYNLRENSKIVTNIIPFQNDYGRFKFSVRLTIFINYLCTTGFNVMSFNNFEFKANKKAVFLKILNLDVTRILKIY